VALAVMSFFLDKRLERDDTFPEGVEGTWFSTKVGGGVLNSFKLLWDAV
jgi:hypothetical protein